MRLGKASVFGGLVVGTMTIGLATPALADPGDVVVQPAQARPGDKITIVGKKCHTDGTATSSAFVGGTIPLNGAEEVVGRAGLATIKNGTSPGTYDVLVTCGNHTSTGQVHVVGGKTYPKTQTTPNGGAATGFGGVSGGADTALLTAGGVLLLGAAGVGVMAARRRNDAAGS